ncbi:MAG: 2,3-bisphosphoglycerate-independent phosphoglycerate mutase [Holosporales bacterium]|jgi:2,3-bisphosphoglycerate-independent phosphoglycerate mutase|nr:2,3-bisphosphoglycerate-independent phosphoglycerate mutase [Holosporales bacterium]
MKALKRKVLLIILDGFGVSGNGYGDATLEAKFIQSLRNTYPNSLLNASEEHVGLPSGQFGNSEVGHMTISSGKVVKQKLLMINDSISSCEFDQNPVLLNFLQNTKTCHIMGLFSDGGVHSHISHLFHCLKLLRLRNIKIRAHLFLDGRDVTMDSALNTLKTAVSNELIKVSEIASVHGRYYAMDRDRKWERTEVSYNAIKNADSAYKNVEDPIKMIEFFYKSGVFDENMPPFVMKGYSGALSNDSFWNINFRTDRMKQILTLIHSDGFKILNMTNVDEKIDRNSAVLFEKKEIKNTLGEVISKNGLRQLRIAETEKYAHITYFMNGGEDITYENEFRILVDSPKVADYAETPDMSSSEITQKLKEALSLESYDLIIVNYANADMIGHTGNFEICKKSLRMLDEHVKNVVETARNHEYEVLITADHGNAEHMINENDGTFCKTHSLSKVPFVYISDDRGSNLKNGSLQDIAPTVLSLLGIKIPNDMEGSCLIK